MTYKAFLSALRKTPRRWELVGTRIRLHVGNRYDCPISKVTGCDMSEVFDAPIAGDAQWQIVLAADRVGEYDPAIRRDLLKACGLARRKSAKGAA